MERETFQRWATPQWRALRAFALSLTAPGRRALWGIEAGQRDRAAREGRRASARLLYRVPK
jgi:hypothetical protein